jgi:spermidine/putrescine transport system substrate-binding protein
MMSDLDRLVARRLGRRDFMRYAGVAAGAGVLAACKKAVTTGSGPSSASGAARPPIDKEPGSLQVFDWSGYGAGDYYPGKEKQSIWADYQKATGDTPKFILFENDDAGFTKVAAGARYDVIHPCAYRFKDYVDLGVVQPWDTSLIPNYTQLDPMLEQAGVIDNKQYFIVEDWGFIAPLYRADKVQPLEDSWSLLWDDRYSGRISWINTLEMLVIAGYYNQVPDPWTMTDDELAQMRDFLISKKHLVQFLWDQSYDLWRAFKRGDVWIGYAWPDTVGYATAAGMDVVYMQPKEGRIWWSCGLGMFADSANYYHAHEYANSWSTTKAALFLESSYYYGHANSTVDMSQLSPAIVKAFSLDDLSAALSPPAAHIESWVSRRSVYSQYWSEVLAA